MAKVSISWQLLEQEFRNKFRSIVYLRSELKANENHLRSLHAWDKNGTHTNAILKANYNRKAIKHELLRLQNGEDYEVLLAKSKKLSRIKAKYNNAKKNIEQAEKQLSEFEF